MSEQTYKIELHEDGTQSIECLVCGMTSYSTGDVEHLYCGNCHEYHDIMEAKERLKNYKGLSKRFKNNVSFDKTIDETDGKPNQSKS